MRLTLARLSAILDAAAECLDAYERLARTVADLPQSSDLPGDIARALTNTDLRPSMDAILTLRLERERLKTARRTKISSNPTLLAGEDILDL